MVFNYPLGRGTHLLPLCPL